MNPRHNILATDGQGRSARGAEGYMQDGPIFRDIDSISAKHCIDSIPQSRFNSELEEQAERVGVDAIF